MCKLLAEAQQRTNDIMARQAELESQLNEHLVATSEIEAKEAAAGSASRARLRICCARLSRCASRRSAVAAATSVSSADQQPSESSLIEARRRRPQFSMRVPARSG